MPPAAQHEAPDPSVGYLIGGKYRVQGILGRGGTGHVFEAVQEPIGRHVAVKVLRPDLPPDEQWQFEARFLREASRAGALQHPNIVTVHDYGRTDDGLCYIVMELLRGRSLKELLKDGPVPVRRALDIFEQILKGLRAAHLAGLVHRDIKPGNIILCAGDDGRDLVKILDFGLVKDHEAEVARGLESQLPGEELLPDDAHDAVVTRHGAFLGTPHYIAPEQARGGAVDARADLYSAGVVLYRMVCGALPYYDRNPTALALMHVNQPYPPMASRAPGVAVAPEIEAVARRCMEKRPEDRYPSADVILAELALVRRALFPEGAFGPQSVVSGDTLAADVPPTPAPAPRSRGLLGALALLVLGLGAGGAWLATRSEPAPALSPDPAPTSAPVAALSTTPATPEAPIATPAPATPAAAPAPAPAPAAAPRHTAASSRAPSSAPGTAKAQPAASAPPAPAPSPEATPAPASSNVPASSSASATSSGGAQRLDGVSFTADEASAALRWLNDAPESEVRGAGITARQVKILLEGRPWASLSAFAATYDIGPKTVEAVKAAASR